jgi:hypothetical protein
MQLHETLFISINNLSCLLQNSRKLLSKALKICGFPDIHFPENLLRLPVLVSATTGRNYLIFFLNAKVVLTF